MKLSNPVVVAWVFGGATVAVMALSALVVLMAWWA